MDPRINVITPGVKGFCPLACLCRDGPGWNAGVQDDIAIFPLHGMIVACYPRDKRAKDATVPL